MVTKRNRQMTGMDLHGNTYKMQILIKADQLEDLDSFAFTLENRLTNQVIALDITDETIDDPYIRFELAFDYHQHAGTVFEHGESSWDVYLNRTREDDHHKSRIRSDYSDIGFLAITLPDEEMVFQPFTTRKGNVSFRLTHYQLDARIDHVTLEGAQINVSGHINFPPLYQADDHQLEGIQLVVTNNRDDREMTFPLEKIERPDLSGAFSGNECLLNSGIRATLPLNDFLTLEKPVFLKLYVDMSYTHMGETATIRSTRVRLDHRVVTQPVQEKLRRNGKAFKITVTPTRDSKHLSLKIADYHWRKEMASNIKGTWVRVRRSKQLLRLYEKAFRVLGKLPVRKKTVVFESFHGKQYSDSPRAIYEYMQTHMPDHQLYWSADRRHLDLFAAKELPYVRRFSVKWLFLMARAAYWVSNARLPLWIPKPKHTTYVQTWHGTPLKRLAADMDEVHMPGTNTEKYKENFTREAAKWDYLVSPNAYSSSIFRRAFRFKGEMIESGYPRNDFLLNGDQTDLEDIKARCGLPHDKKVILYAPTWRDNMFYRKGRYKFNLELDLEQMREKLGDDYVIVLRLHYLVAENLDLSGFESFVYDLSAHEDIRELYMIADMLITDYSSVFFDYANLNRPMIFFVYDIEDYRDNLRGFYFDFERKAPGPLVKTTDELLEVIEEIDQNGYQPSETTDAFRERFCYLEDGHATERVVNAVFRS
ncbi:Teichoic acid poly(glycerol phosphate) polymerase [Lentibacillus sp. JNUCC-1]|uniref:CDP-glycerol glycerophosphotransferase family protein n=1 Tax=Lentibacillus sp. JNUCC-1 TaxID=2654513 RepID=UPI0012E82DC0|nr:CDP-glycerol glycerophosphotransferase family protein [Lentibacillus sp. JNUCC-1]MUV37298.1 Teichoic acid poly(glycerol phosphate) polymerase [Lentibacillus sp. JNUCC-1]